MFCKNLREHRDLRARLNRQHLLAGGMGQGHALKLGSRQDRVRP